MIKVTPLFSGSKGNCTLIQSDNTNILLDLGFGYRAILCALERYGLRPKDIDGIIITHEHADHIGALAMWTKHNYTKVYVPSQIAEYVSMRSYCTNVSAVSGSFVVGDIAVEQYSCSHDSIACCGYRFGNDGNYVASITDTGTFSALGTFRTTGAGATEGVPLYLTVKPASSSTCSTAAFWAACTYKPPGTSFSIRCTTLVNAGAVSDLFRNTLASIRASC